MRVPFRALQVSGDVLVAGGGCDIHTFSIQTGSHLSTWRYPLVEKSIPVAAAPLPGRESSDLIRECAVEDDANQGSPAKRRRLDGSQDVHGGEPLPSNGTIEQTSGQATGRVMFQDDAREESISKSEREIPGKKKKSRAAVKAALQPAPERPMIQCIEATADGRHVIAVTGSDKSIWVFEHEGGGRLRQVSQRTMPKRPAALALTSDGRTILAADKFGDVYSLPLLQSDAGPERAHGVSPFPALAGSPAGAAKFEPAANLLTVHTERNRRALEFQRRQPKVARTERPSFEHSLLLGHVSMLTAVALAVRRNEYGGGREYVITADRDEHIRVSRGMPQTHVIQSYCLGHTEFVSRLCVLGDLLVSGGGDDELFVWDWHAGQLLGTVDLLAHVCQVDPAAQQLAVSILKASPLPASGDTPSCAFVVAACERIPALFCFRLDGKSLLYEQTVLLPRTPLDLVVVGDADVRLVVSLDNTTTGPDAGIASDHNEPLLAELAWERGAGWTATKSSYESINPDGDDDRISLGMLSKASYALEQLRKHGLEED